MSREVINSVCKRLDELFISYELAYHDRVSTMEECRLPMQLLGAVMPRNLLLTPRNQSEYWLLMCSPDSVFRTSSVSKQLGASRLGFAPGEKLSDLMNTHSGALSPFGLFFDADKAVRAAIDEALLEEEYLLFHPLDNTATVKLKTSDLTGILLPSLGYKLHIVRMEKNE